MRIGICFDKSLRRLATIGIFVASSTLATPLASSADPITLTYAVTVNTRCVLGACSTFNASFNLNVTFDSQTVDQGSGPTGAFAIYGQPRFSPIPLPRIAVDPSATPTLSTRVLESWQQGPLSLTSYSFFATEEYELLTAATMNEWTTSLARRLLLAEPPAELSAATLETRLARLGPADFVYGFTQTDRGTGDLNPGSIGYLGKAQLQVPSTVPEPASLLLLGSGVAGVAAWRRRTRNRDQST